LQSLGTASHFKAKHLYSSLGSSPTPSLKDDDRIAVDGLASLRQKNITMEPDSPEQAFAEVSELPAFNTIRLQRALALARYHALIHDYAAAIDIAEDAIGAASIDYGEDGEYVGKPGFDQAKYDQEREAINVVFALDDLVKEMRGIYEAQQDAEEVEEDEGTGGASGGESIEGFGAAKPVSTVT
jgi:CO dehydrogenase/acetyl-CoA synthase delta subunit